MAFSVADVTAEFGLLGLISAFAVTETLVAGTGGTETFAVPLPAQPQAYWFTPHPKANLVAVRASEWLVQVTATDLIAESTSAANSGDAAPQIIVYVVQQWSTVLRSRLREALVAAATVQAART